MFLAIAFGLSWSYWAILWLAGVSTNSLLWQFWLLPGAFAPALACLIVRRWVTREGFADVGHRLNLRSHWGYYLFAWLSPLAVTAVIVLLALGLNISQPDFSLQQFFQTYVPQADAAAIPDHVLIIATWGTLIQAVLVATPVVWGEEFGWRGYLQLRLFAQHPLKAAIATGLIWGVWHAPLTLMGYEQYENPILGLLIFPVFTVWLSIIFGWLRLKTQSLWAVCLAHGATNAIGASLTLMLFGGGTNWTWVGYNGILAWIPLGAISMWIVCSDRLPRSISLQDHVN